MGSSAEVTHCRWVKQQLSMYRAYAATSCMSAVQMTCRFSMHTFFPGNQAALTACLMFSYHEP